MSYKSTIFEQAARETFVLLSTIQNTILEDRDLISAAGATDLLYCTMVVLKDFEVKVALKTTDGLSPGDAIKEYPNPEPGTSSDEWLAERYIEAKPGQEFQVEVYLKPSFKLFAADRLKVSFCIDNGTVDFYKAYKEKQIAGNISEGKPFIIHSVLDTDGRQHSRVSFSFGSLTVGKWTQTM